jgi:hypothetical protein
MPTARFARLIGVPERSYRRWQQRERQGRPLKGPWPAPARDRLEPVAVDYADRFPAWGHRKLAMLMRVDGHHAPDSTVLRALRSSGRVQPVDYQAERRQLAQARRAAFVAVAQRPAGIGPARDSHRPARLAAAVRVFARCVLAPGRSPRSCALTWLPIANEWALNVEPKIARFVGLSGILNAAEPSQPG